jgi:hypothetical protein
MTEKLEKERLRETYSFFDANIQSWQRLQTSQFILQESRNRLKFCHPFNFQSSRSPKALYGYHSIVQTIFPLLVFASIS